MRRPPQWVRTLLRPLVPDRVMARFRLAEHSRQVRTNVDVFLPTHDRTARRWLATTPDTYRVRSAFSPASVPEWRRVAVGQALDTTPQPDEVIVVADSDGDAAIAAAPLRDPEIHAGVLGEVGPLRLIARRRTEPTVGPRAVAVRAAAWSEVGGAPPGPLPLPGLLARLRDAGFRIGLVPQREDGAAVERADPVGAPSVVVLALVPVHDVGGGSRGAQMALEFLQRGYHVTYVALFGTAESTDLGLRFVHPGLEQYRLDQFDVARLSARLGDRDRLAIVEAPAAPYVEMAVSLRRSGYRVVYDLIDDWSAPALGGQWYQPQVEARLAASADALVASAPDLVKRLGRFGTVALVPNAVNDRIFAGDPGGCPSDFPPGEGPVLGYHGSLDANWFDWHALAAVAASRPEARLVVIGDVRSEPPALPTNVHLLGLKPQTTLLPYVARFDAGLVPFVVSPATHAVSPLKAYEYLAAGVPVAAPPLRALEGVAGVHLAADLNAAVELALAAPRPDRAAVLDRHSWGARLEVILGAVGGELANRTTPPAEVVIRPAVHWPAAQRRA